MFLVDDKQSLSSIKWGNIQRFSLYTKNSKPKDNKPITSKTCHRKILKNFNLNYEK